MYSDKLCVHASKKMVLYIKVVPSMNGLPLCRDHSLEVYPSSSDSHHFSIHYARSGGKIESSAAHEL